VPPLVGISQRLRSGEQAGRDRLELDPAYARALAEAGAVPVHLPWPADPRALVARIDALVIPGGPDFLWESLLEADDVAPGSDGSPPAATAPATVPLPSVGTARVAQPVGESASPVRFDPVDPRQLAFDRALVAAALAREIPVLGICYGMQLLALHAGARLHLHLPRDLPGAGRHRGGGREDARHGLRVEPGTRLAALLGTGDTEVNSSHHQAVSNPGAWRVAARAPDGVIEAVEPPGAASGCLRLGVQWHPERMDPAHRGALFGALVEAAGRRRGSAGSAGAGVDARGSPPEDPASGQGSRASSLDP